MVLRVREGVGAAGLGDARARGEEPDFQKFMEEYGDFFPENPATLDELLASAKIQPAVYEESETTEPATRNSKNPVFVENVADLNVRRSVRTVLSRFGWRAAAKK